MAQYEIEFYLKYDHLYAADMAVLFDKLDKLFVSLVKRAYMNDKPNVLFSEEQSGYFLEIQSMNTGNSLHLKFNECWKSLLNASNGQPDKNTPIKLGIPVIINYLLLLGVQKLSGKKNETLNQQLKELELKLKEKKQGTKIMLNEFTLLIKLFHRVQQKQAQNIIEFLLNNANIYYVEINGLVIKK